ncbi:MAG TPA: ferredoxin [Jatrophihabitantaceae bacterium]|nr:ferredoxin [Jatrophihabitantaceae bacterium]
MGAHRRRGERAGRLRVDPVQCEAVGICLHVAPTLLRADRWGFPITTPNLSGRADHRAARAAVAACPRRALFIEAAPPPSG